jgi:hypothetical protein
MFRMTVQSLEFFFFCVRSKLIGPFWAYCAYHLFERIVRITFLSVLCVSPFWAYCAYHRGLSRHIGPAIPLDIALPSSDCCLNWMSSGGSRKWAIAWYWNGLANGTLEIRPVRYMRVSVLCEADISEFYCISLAVTECHQTVTYVANRYVLKSKS